MNLLLHSISKLFILRKTIVSGIAHITSTFSTRIGELCHDLKLLSKIQIKQRVGVEKTNCITSIVHNQTRIIVWGYGTTKCITNLVISQKCKAVRSDHFHFVVVVGNLYFSLLWFTQNYARRRE